MAVPQKFQRRMGSGQLDRANLAMMDPYAAQRGQQYPGINQVETGEYYGASGPGGGLYTRPKGGYSAGYERQRQQEQNLANSGYGYGAPPVEDYRVPADTSMPPAGSDLTPQQMANWLIRQHLGTQAAVVGGTVALGGSVRQSMASKRSKQRLRRSSFG